MQPFLVYRTCLIFLATRGENLTVCAECEIDFFTHDQTANMAETLNDLEMEEIVLFILLGRRRRQR